MPSSGGGISSYLGSKWAAVVVVAAAAAGALVAPSVTGGGGGQSCTGADVTTATFASRVSGSSAGNTLCLLNGSYGTFSGTNKAITIAAKTGQTAVNMQVCFGTGDTGFTIDGMKNMGGGIGSSGCTGGATNITIKNSTFTDNLFMEGSSIHGIVVDSNVSDWAANSGAGDSGGKFDVGGASGNEVVGTIADPAVTISNNHIANGDLDGVHVGGASGVIVQGNEIVDLCDIGVNHTDGFQIDRSTNSQILVKANYIHVTTSSCPTQSLSWFDCCTSNVTVEDNVIDVYWTWGIDIFSDTNSIIRHNTVVYHPGASCSFGNSCGRIELDSKTSSATGTGSDDPPGTGTHVYDNVMTKFDIGRATLTQDHNMCRETGCTGTGTLNTTTPIFVGGSAPTTYAGFCLTALSPGKGAASDGLDMGIRC